MGLTQGQLALNAGILQSGMQVGSGISGFIQGRQNAKILNKRGKQAQAARIAEGKQIAGAQRARSAASGVDPNVGSPRDVARQTIENSRVNAIRERFAFENEAAGQKTEGTNALLGGLLGGGSTLLTALAREKQADEGIRIIGKRDLPATSTGFDPFTNPLTGERLG